MLNNKLFSDLIPKKVANISENKQPHLPGHGCHPLTDLFLNYIHDRILINLHAFQKASGIITISFKNRFLYIYICAITFLETVLCGVWVYSSLLRSQCLSQQPRCFYVLSCRWQKRSGCGQRASEKSQIAYWILKAHPQRQDPGRARSLRLPKPRQW